MSEIRISPPQVTDVGNQFRTKAGELEALVNQAKGLMNSLEGAWMGQRKNTTFAEWNSMQTNLQNAIQTLHQTSQLLVRAASDFAQVDSAR